MRGGGGANIEKNINLNGKNLQTKGHGRQLPGAQRGWRIFGIRWPPMTLKLEQQKKMGENLSKVSSSYIPSLPLLHSSSFFSFFW
jgi:hypothetical protein